MPYSIHRADNDEYWKKLKEKLVEEAGECVDADASIEELADVLEVIDTIIDFKEINRNELHDQQRKKREERGGFKKKIILDES